MKFLLLSFLLSINAVNITAQLITNGNMEIGAGGTNTVPTDWDIISGTPDHCDISPSSCTDLANNRIQTASPQGGKWVRFGNFVALGGQQYELFGQKLCSSLISGEQYTLSFYAAYSNLNISTTATSTSIMVGFSKGMPSGSVGALHRDTVFMTSPDNWIYHTYTFNAAGNYDYISFGKEMATDQNNICYIDDVKLTGSTSFISVAISPANVTLCNANSVELTVSGADTYTWLPVSGISASTGSTVLAKPEETTTYTVTGKSTIGCMADTQMVVVNVCDCGGAVFVPNAFSPNTDGVNDVLYVKTNCGLEQLDFKVYDRWGNNVFESANVTEGWDGTNKEKAMDPAVFVYYLEAVFTDGKQAHQKGNISLVK